MKIAVLADIHANLAAFEATIADILAWAPDQVVIAGDIINRGPQPRACLELALQLRDTQGWQLLRGNHEGYLLRYDRDRHDPAFLRSGPRYEVSRPTIWTYAQVADLLPAVAALPERHTLDLAAGRLTVMHASVRHDRDGIMRDSSDTALREQIDLDAHVFCVGHTHMPFVRWLAGTLVVNVGAVGLPFDGDVRAAYARISAGGADWRAEIVRLPYDRASTERAYYESGLLDQVGAIGQIMLREQQTASSLLYDFVPRYVEPILAGSITLAGAVAEFLRDDRP